MAVSRELEKIAADYWEWKLESDPTWATYLGDHRWNDKLSDISAAGRAKEAEAARAFLKRLAAVDAAKLPETERVSHSILVLALQELLDEQKYKFYQWPVDQLYGIQVGFLELVNFHPFRNEKDALDFAARCEALPKFIDDMIAALREGMKEGRVSPNVAVVRVIGQLKAIVSTPAAKSPLADAIPKIAALKLPDTVTTKLTNKVTGAIEGSVVPAFGKLLAFLEKEYKGRDEIGCSATPNGLEAYQHRCRLRTTTNLTYQQLHQVGLDEIASIRAEMTAIMKKLGHDGDIASFIAKIKADPANQPKSREEVLEGFRAIMAKANAALPKWFGVLPKNKCVVKSIEEYREKDAPAAYYYQSDSKLTRDGVFYANTYHPESRYTFNAAALTIHEAVPGHHLQIAIALEIPGLPDFRRNTHFTAYIEGWALYTERLGEEMGLYENDLERFGMLTYQALRACRLVVDTGMHALGWSRDKALAYMRENVAEPEGEILNEIDRYIIWPGQALAYKVGQREIYRLREEAKKKLGAKFDIRSFHDVVLRNGALPLTTLGEIVAKWTEERAKQ